LNGAVFHLRYLGTEQPLDELRIATRNHQLRPTEAALDIFQEDLEALTRIVALALNLFAPRHDALGAAQIDTYDIALDAGDGGVDNRANLIFILGHDDFALG